jgi:hypothetical protein
LLVVAVHHNGIEVLGHQPLDCCKRLGAGFNGEFQFAQDLGHYASGLVIWAE